MARVLALGWILFAFATAGCGREMHAVTECMPSGPLTPVCTFRNPEDLVALPDGEWLLVSQFPEGAEELPEGGSLVAYRPSDGAVLPLDPARRAASENAGARECPGPPDAERFGPHGIDLTRAEDGALRLLVVNHGGREAIEIFAVESTAQGPSLAWEGCIPLPEDVRANDVVALPDGAVAATHFLPRKIGLVTMLRLLLGLTTGRVLVWKPDAGWSAVPNSEESAPNGIAASRDGATLYVTSWAGQKIVRIGRDGSARREAELSFLPDNLTWMSDGRLLVAGQIGSLLDVRACSEIERGSCGLPFALVIVDPESLAMEDLFVHDPPTHGGAASVALEHEGVVWVGTFHGDRLLRVDCL